MNELMMEYKEVFLEEAAEHLQAMMDSLLEVEKRPDDKKEIDTLFRVAHTLKSSCAAVGLLDISKLAHKAEDLMVKIRAGEMGVNGEIIDAFFSFCDIVKAVLDMVRENKEAIVDTEPLFNRLFTLLEGRSLDEIKPMESPVVVQSLFVPIVPDEASLASIAKAKESGWGVWQVDIEIDQREPVKWLRVELILNAVKSMGETIDIRPAKNELIKPNFNGEFSFLFIAKGDEAQLRSKFMVDLVKNVRLTSLVEEQQVSDQDLEDSLETTDVLGASPIESADAREKENNPAKKKSVARVGETIRVNISKLDDMMNLIGELATAVSGMKQIERTLKAENPRSKALLQTVMMADKLTNLSTDLQYSIMNTRMMPVAMAFNQFQRVVRDLSKTTGKQVELLMKDEDTELDKKVIDAIGEPLMHLVRNAIDHGLEMPEEREKKGKPPIGKITLGAARDGNHILITVTDDGRGIDTNRIREKIVQAGLTTAEEAAKMEDDKVMQYIFEAGFSTKEMVSDISGRGVGLDVVNNVMMSLGGTVDIRTELGMGTEFIMILPLTLTTTFVILTQAGANVFAIPISDVRESLGMKDDQIKTVDNQDVIMLRGEVLPLVNLRKAFGNVDGDDMPVVQTGKRKNKKYVIVVSYRNMKIGLIVDKILGTEEIVQKPLEKHYKVIKGLSGVSILGDGSIVLAVDIMGLVQLIKEGKGLESMDVSKIIRHP